MEKAPLDPVSAKLLYETIILDTSNFSKEAARTTRKDEDITMKLEGILKCCGQMRTDIYIRLKKAKSDVAGMSLTQLLRKDQKLLEAGSCRLIISSIPVPVQVSLFDT